MEHAMTMVPAGLVGVLQDGQSLPNTVPGIGPAPAATGEHQAAPAGPGVTGGQTQQVPALFNPMTMMIVLVLVFLVVSTMMSSRREKKRAAQMLSSLKRGDRVLTAGGMIGTVHEVREDSIVLRVDDVSGAKAHFTRGAVQQVLRSAKPDGKSDNGADAVAEAG